MKEIFRAEVDKIRDFFKGQAGRSKGCPWEGFSNWAGKWPKEDKQGRLGIFVVMGNPEGSEASVGLLETRTQDSVRLVMLVSGRNGW